MADIYLGLTESGAELLPPIRWTGGGAPEFGIDYTKQSDKASMLSGATRFNLRLHHPRRWRLEWEMLTAAELAALMVLHAHDEELAFQNNWEDATWREVVITSFDYAPFLKSGATGCRYSVSMTLEEVV
jgi:hypothetical protein